MTLTQNTRGDRRGEPESTAAVLGRILSFNTPAAEMPTSEEAAPPAPRCAVCGDIGFVYDLPPDDPDTRSRPCKCQLGRDNRLAEFWRKYSHVPDILRGLRLETHPNLIAGQPHNAGLLARLQDTDVASSSWMLWGANSVGKSGIAAALAWRSLIETGAPVRWWTWPDLLGEIRRSFDRDRERERDHAQYGAPPHSGPQWTEGDLIDVCATVPLLVLDDLAAGRHRESGPDSWATDVLFRIISRRHAWQRPTVITSNVDLIALRDLYDVRITERIVEMTDHGANIVRVTGENLRA